MAWLSRLDGTLGKLDEWYFRLHRHVNRRSPALFHRGWGDPEVIAAINSRWLSPPEVAAIDVRWHGDWAAAGTGLWQRCGSFASPAHPEHLPEEVACAGFVFVRPAPRGTPPTGPGPVALLMPTTREAGVSSRLPTARVLARRGISSLLLESPFMGSRKPAYQHGRTLAQLSDFLLLSATAIEEGRSLLHWLKQQGFDELCVAGISKGGYLATVTGLKAQPAPHVVAALAPHSGSAVLVDGLIGRLCDWEQLQRTSGSTRPVREQLIELFETSSLDHLELPAPPARLTMIGARNDRYVPMHSYERLARRWAGRATVQWLPGGHVSTIAESSHYTNAICASFGRA